MVAIAKTIRRLENIADSKDDSDIDNKSTAKQQQINTNKNVKKEKNIIYSQDELDILNFWNKNAPINHKQTLNMQKEIKRALKKYSKEKILTSIKRYIGIYESDYKYDNIWRLDKFLKQSNGIPNYFDDGQVYLNFAKWWKDNKKQDDKPKLSDTERERIRKKLEKEGGL